ncbi:MAG: DAK2 domain-containing protein [Thermoleophilaceae bacterium]|nr:DAK2 domain-containing protein [Thermoleophilaceae bacterium]
MCNLDRVPDPSLVRFRRVVESSCEALEARREEINDLNVFPVADGDTGDNMARTLRAVLDALDDMTTDGRAIDEIGRNEIVQAVARAALLGARGNSGVILSQIVRGLAEEFASRPGQRIDPALVASALNRASDAAYASVREPQEGTMLTVIREIASRVSQMVAHMDDASFPLDIDDDSQDVSLAGLIDGAVSAGETSVARSPELLPLLKESGVVDSGGYGMVVIMSGALAALSGDIEAPGRVSHYIAPASGVAVRHQSSKYQFCTNFAVTGTELSAEHFRPDLERLGDSVLVVGDETTLRIHVHTNDPDEAMSLFQEFGSVVDVELEDMHAMVAARNERRGGQAGVVFAAEAPRGNCGVVAVVSAGGIAELFSDLGATVVDGGETMNPSTEELIAAIDAAPEHEIILLPNSGNVILAAERAVELAGKPAELVPTTSQQAGLAAAVALNPASNAELNASSMAVAVAVVRTGGVAAAARDDADGRFRKGDAVGFIDDSLVAWGSAGETLKIVFDQLGDGAELMTCISGAEPPLSLDEVRGLAPPEAELELLDGGQPNWWWLISAE